MSMRKSVEYKDDELDIRLIISRADVTIGMERSLLISRAEPLAPLKEDASELDVMRHEAQVYARSFLYPSLIASVVEHEGFDHWPVTPEEFTALPEPFVIDWESATFELNPHWKLKFPDTEEEKATAQKKVTSST